MKFKKLFAGLSALCMAFTGAVMPVNADWYDDEIPSIIGDVYHDGMINAKDAAGILNFISDLNVGLKKSDMSHPIDSSLADVDNDGYIDVDNITFLINVQAMILNAVANQGVGLPTEEDFKSEYADVDRDGAITALDASYVLNYCGAIGTGTQLLLSEHISQELKPETPSGSEADIEISQLSITLEELQQCNYQVPVFVQLTKNPKISAAQFGIKADERLHYQAINLYDAIDRSSYMPDRLLGEFQQFFYGWNYSSSREMTTRTNENALWATWACGYGKEETGTLLVLWVDVPSDAKAGDKFEIQFQHEGTASNAMFALAKAAVYNINATDGYIYIQGESEQEFTQGDATGDGEVDILDVITVNKAFMGKETLTEVQLKAIDFNGNGKPDSDEALTILKYIVGMITDFTA